MDGEWGENAVYDENESVQRRGGESVVEPMLEP